MEAITYKLKEFFYSSFCLRISCMHSMHVNWIYLPLPLSLAMISSELHELIKNPLSSLIMPLRGCIPVFPFTSSHQLPIAPQLVLELHESFFYPCWDFVRILCRSCASSHSYCEFMCTVASTCKQMLFCCRHLLPVALTVFLFCLQWFLSPGGRDVIVLSHLELSIPQSYSLHVDQLEVSVLITLYCVMKLLRWGLSNVLIYEYKVKNGEFVTISIEQNDITYSVLFPRAYVLACARVLAQLTVPVWVLSCAASFKSNQKWVVLPL